MHADCNRLNRFDASRHTGPLALHVIAHPFVRRLDHRPGIPLAGAPLDAVRGFIMTSERVTLANARCLIDIESRTAASGQQQFVAHLSVIEADGRVVRPLVGPDRRRIRIQASSARIAVRVAMVYLEGRFGRVLSSEPGASLSTATVGTPIPAG